jgi:hypothetical protein
MKYLIITSLITTIISWILFWQTVGLVVGAGFSGNSKNDIALDFLVLQPFLSTAFTVAAWLLNNRDFNKFIPFLTIVSILSCLATVIVQSIL